MGDLWALGDLWGDFWGAIGETFRGPLGDYIMRAVMQCYEGISNRSACAEQEDEFEIKFEVQCNDGAHVGLFGQDVTDTETMYEFVIGGWKNTKSAIRRGSTGAVQKLTNGILSESEYRSFVVNITASGLMKLASPDDGIILEWTDPDPLVPSYVGFMTGWGSTGKWKLERMPQPYPKGIPTNCELRADHTFQDEDGLHLNGAVHDCYVAVEKDDLPAGHDLCL